MKHHLEKDLEYFFKVCPSYFDVNVIGTTAYSFNTAFQSITVRNLEDIPRNLYLGIS